MLDLRSIREDPEPARLALGRRGAAEQLDELLRLDARRREILPEVEEGRAGRNRVSGEIPQLNREGQGADELIPEMRELGGGGQDRAAGRARGQEGGGQAGAAPPQPPG